MIPPRTKGESEAFAAGYAQAVHDVQEYGLAQATRFLDVIAGPLEVAPDAQTAHETAHGGPDDQ